MSSLTFCPCPWPIRAGSHSVCARGDYSPLFPRESLRCCAVIACLLNCLPPSVRGKIWEGSAVRVSFAITFSGLAEALAFGRHSVDTCGLNYKSFQQLRFLPYFFLHSSASAVVQPLTISPIDYGKSSIPSPSHNSHPSQSSYAQ